MTPYLVTAIQILERSRRLTPYWRDQAVVRERLLRLFPRHAASHGLVDDALDLPSRLRHGCQPAAAWLAPRPPAAPCWCSAIWAA